MIKLVAFDLDGTIGDTLPLCIKAFRMAIEPHIKHDLSEEDITQTFGLNEEGMIKQVIANDNWKIALNDFYTIYEEIHTLCPHPFKGIVELIKELKDKSIPIVLITGKGKKSCDISLKQFGMNKLFDKVETGSPEKNRKSEAIKNILYSYNLSSNEMVYIGDAVSDILECNKAGIRCLSAAWAKSANLEELIKYNKEYVFQNINSMKEYLFTTLKN